MSLRHRLAPCLFTLLLVPVAAQALSLAQLKQICRQAGSDCAQLPMAQAYVGGALDLVAMLDEETEYLGPLYCRAPQDLFDVPAIIGHLLELDASWQEKNAMLGVIDYLERNGGCAQTQRRTKRY
ncbi:MAG: hypothetical protein AAGI15_04445 [Pseudomonadota bacterium]